MGSLILVLLSACSSRDVNQKNGTPLRIGWQTGWATQGQLAQVLQHTDILDRHGLNADFKGFSYGGPLNEAALAGEVDVIFTADQPAATLIARGGKWKIVARLIDFRACVLVPPSSPVHAIGDLRAKTVAIPFGSTTHRIALQMFKTAGLTPDVDVKLKNLDILEQSALAQTASNGRWGGVDAMASWDPTVALLESNKLARPVECQPALSVVAITENLLRSEPDAVVRFLQAYRLAYAYYATHATQANEWFTKETGSRLPSGVLDTAAAYERNMKATRLADVQVGLSVAEISRIQEGADFGLAQKLTTMSPVMREAIDLSYLGKALAAKDVVRLQDVKVR